MLTPMVSAANGYSPVALTFKPTVVWYRTKEATGTNKNTKYTTGFCWNKIDPRNGIFPSIGTSSGNMD